MLIFWYSAYDIHSAPHVTTHIINPLDFLSYFQAIWYVNFPDAGYMRFPYLQTSHGSLRFPVILPHHVVFWFPSAISYFIFPISVTWWDSPSFLTISYTFQMQATSYLQYPPLYQISTVQIIIIVNIYAHDTTMHVYIYICIEVPVYIASTVLIVLPIWKLGCSSFRIDDVLQSPVYMDVIL